MPNIGPVELIIILVILLVIFGPKRLPGLGKQLGSGMREFKDGITGKDKDDERERERDRARDAERTGVAGLPAAEPTTDTDAVDVDADAERQHGAVRATRSGDE